MTFKQLYSKTECFPDPPETRYRAPGLASLIKTTTSRRDTTKLCFVLTAARQLALALISHDPKITTWIDHFSFKRIICAVLDLSSASLEMKG